VTLRDAKKIVAFIFWEMGDLGKGGNDVIFGWRRRPRRICLDLFLFKWPKFSSLKYSFLEVFDDIPHSF
jgi:hypothetical protein